MVTSNHEDSIAAPASVLATPTARGVPTVRASRAAREGKIKARPERGVPCAMAGRIAPRAVPPAHAPMPRAPASR